MMVARVRRAFVEFRSGSIIEGLCSFFESVRNDLKLEPVQIFAATPLSVEVFSLAALVAPVSFVLVRTGLPASASKPAKVKQPVVFDDYFATFRFHGALPPLRRIGSRALGAVGVVRLTLVVKVSKLAPLLIGSSV